MKAVVRPFASTDLEAVARLRSLVFERSELSDARWQSSFWDWLNRHPLSDEIHRWVLDAEGEVVGHLAALPQYYRIGGRRIIAHAPADYGVLPKYGFYAFPLMRRLFLSCDNCVACDLSPSVIGIEERLGAAKVADLQFAAKVWDVSHIPNLPVTIPSPLRRCLRAVLITMDAALNVSSLDRAFGQDHKVEVIERFDETFDELFETVAASVPCVPEKDSAFLSWRYGPNSPQGSATVLGVKESGRLLGYAVFWVTAEGRDGHLLDLMTLPGRRDVARALLRESSRRLRHSKVSSIKYRFVESSTSPLTKDAWPLGFYFSKKRRFALLIRFKDLGLHQEALNRDNWTYNFGDSETTFWLR